ncbi:response regulator [Streptomyces sp. SID8374]|uniref:response regulator transcription factor n=1 Tax=Streptomyces sp. SID8374 TaxID=2690354 RepID=UPI0013CA02F2|nr:response regulator transcription factor [Streptomyces sp. SID8374]MYX13567.1 response regulator [Streptomyces sp. SID8374]
MRAHILVAEDDRKQAELLTRYLEREGHTVRTVHDGREALDQVRRREPDLAVLDWMMPRVDGLDVLRVLRAEDRELPVLLLTARSTEDDLLLGLDLGADDYITKPYSPRELVARVRTLLRRTARGGPSPADESDLRVGALRVSPERHEVTVNDRPVECTPGEFRLLAAMAARPGQVFTRDRLLDVLDGFGHYTTSRAVDMHIMNLRRKTEDDPRSPRRLVTVFGVGYKLLPPDGTEQPGKAASARPVEEQASARPIGAQDGETSGESVAGATRAES